MIVGDKHLQRSANNFDALRLIAAAFVLIGHAPAILTNSQLPWDPAIELFGLGIHTLGVIIFFTISGFLVTGSWESRKHVTDFLLARFLRIFPAVICVVLMSVFILGASLTTWTLPAYLMSDITFKYLQDMTLYRMYYYLPGVFETNPIGGSVNGSLWTLPYEFTCYLFLMVLGILSALKNKWISFTLLFVAVPVYLVYNIEIDVLVIPVLGIDFKHFFVLYLYFLAGSVFYQFRKYIPLNVTGLAICIIAMILVKLHYIPSLLMVFIIPYLIFLFSFSGHIKLNRAGKYGDFSYGLFLYAFPVQQLIVYFSPASPGLPAMILLSLVFTFPCAVLSWRIIEKPCLTLRRKIFPR